MTANPDPHTDPATDPNHPRRRSFVPVAADSHFPIQNLPFGIFSTPADPERRVGVAIGDRVLDLSVIAAAGLLPAEADADVFTQSSLNPFITNGPAVWRSVRAAVSHLLDAETPTLRDDTALRARALVPMADARMHLPVEVGGYTDFYSSRHHAANVGRMFRGVDKPLLPNWLHLPVAYNGRASSVVVSGTPIPRPLGQTIAPGEETPRFGPCAKLDFELETAFVVGVGNPLGVPVPVDDAESRIFGVVLLNDWSARDIQQWEYAPLGPFNAKSFGTSISPWVVTLDALEPFRVPGPVQEPEPLPYLRAQGDHAFDVALEVAVRPAGDERTTTVCRSNLRHLYWSMAQQLAHHTVSGCNTRVGDLMASGTISGPEPESFASLLELTWNGRDPLTLAGGVTRTFLEDGDAVTITGWCQGDGYRIGFGTVGGRILPAPPMKG